MAKFNIEEYLNDVTYKILYDQYKNLALNMFVWEGLPKGIKSRHIEKLLYEKGKAVFILDKLQGHYCLEGFESGGVDVNGDFKKYRAVGFNYSKEYDVEECVLVENNLGRNNTHDFIQLNVMRLMEIERAIDVNVKAQKTPRIVACDDKDILTFKNIFKQVDGNTPCIYADRNMNLTSLEVLDITAPYVADKLFDLYNEVVNKILTFLGINNANTDKKERLVTSEVESNNEFIGSNAELMLSAREQACKEINEMFGLNVSVKRREVGERGKVHIGDKGDSGE